MTVSNSLDFLISYLGIVISVAQLDSNMYRCKIFGQINWRELRKNPYGCHITTDIDLSIKYKRDIRFHMKFKVPWSLLPETGSIFNPSLSVFYE